MEAQGLSPQIDVTRARWIRYREREKLVDPSSEGFGAGGLARLIHGPSPRLLILSSDPEAHVVEFDEVFWEWWGSEFDDPTTGAQTRWGTQRRPTTTAAVYGSDFGESGWRRFIALHRSGALEIGFGRDGSFARGDQRYFFLGTIVARCWAAFSRYLEVVDRFDLGPPYEICLGLRETQGALLGNFGEGWAGPGDINYITDPCPESNVLIRRELSIWPEGDELKTLAFSVGAQVEDSWGMSLRRYLAHRGDYANEFDPRTARWQ